MKYFFSCLCIFLGVQLGWSQTTYWQQELHYTIDVQLNTKDHSLDAFEKLVYTNHAPDTLRYIWFHLWPNAYKNDKTAFAEQTLRNGSTKFYFSGDSMRGYINRLDFKVDNTPALLEENDQQIDVAKLWLPKPLPPGASITITTPFHVQLPYNFSRGGHVGNSYQITQWYPKPAVYDAKGWHPMSYLDMGEFYSEFGSYEVRITTPANYMVAATGVLQDAQALAVLKKLGKQPLQQQPNYLAYEQQKKAAPALNTTPVKQSTNSKIKITQPAATKTSSFAGIQTFTYKQNHCHDFAWFADPHFLVQYDTVQLADKQVDVFTFFGPEKVEKWKNSIGFAKQALHFYSQHVGTYPYSTAAVVSGAKNENSGGMEYPTITLITTEGNQKELDIVIAHELGHNWFYGALGSNERDHAWMDEAMNSYYEKRYTREKYGNTLLQQANFVQRKLDSNLIGNVLLPAIEQIQKDQPIDTASEAYNYLNYALMVYEKGSAWMQLLEKDLGLAAFDKAMKAYYEQWKFKHPYPADFKQAIEASSQQNIGARFAQLTQTGSLEPVTKKPIVFTLLGNLRSPNKINYVTLTPFVGFNHYDKIMAGLALHNQQLPSHPFSFYIAPAFALGSRQLNLFSKLTYNLHKKHAWWQIGFTAFKYTIDDFTTTDKQKIYQNLVKLIPSIKYTLYDKDARSTHRWIFQARSFLLQEDGLLFKTISTPAGSVDVVSTEANKSTIHQLKITSVDNRALYPYDINLTIDQGSQFVRAAFTTQYFFNYKNGKGGIQARLFAGKFFYTRSQTFVTQYETDRYHLNMSGPKGYEDYTYGGYFIGRNEFEGWMSQQIMQRDGFFKVRTDLLSDKVGKTDDWLAALNFSGPIPEKLNILNALPIKIPVHFFVDIGTYADAWKENGPSGRFLYDAGLQLPLIKGLVNIYVPLLYSKVYGNYFKSTLGEKRFWKTLSFSVDIDKLQPNKLSRNIPL